MKKTFFSAGMIVAGIILVLLVSGCANFVDGLAVISGSGGTIARNDAYDSTVQLARKLKKDQPSTEWESIFPYESTDFIKFMDKDRVLIGTIEIGSALGVPKHREIILYNAGTGQILWKTERKAFTRGSYLLIATKPLILFVGQDKNTLNLFALDPSSGQLRWEHSSETPASFTFSENSDRIFILSQQGSGRKIRCVNAESGNIIWTGDLLGEFFEKDKHAPLFTGDSDIFIKGNKLVKVSGKDGKRLWARGVS